MKQIYLDNSATTQVCDAAVKKAVELMTQCYGNPSSLHDMGFAAEKELSAARERVAEVLGAKPEEIVFTSGGTEANNLAVFGAVEAKKRFGKRIVTTAVEHPSVRNGMAELEKAGFDVIYLLPDGEGHLTEAQIADAIDEKTILVSIMLVNNEVGAIYPVEVAARAIAKKKAPALLHVDAVQAFGKLPMKPKKSGIDLLTISAHKIHGPKGVGALYVAGGVRLAPQVFGGGQEKGLRPGTESLPLIGAFGAAVRSLPPVQKQLEAMRELANDCRQKLLAIDGVMLNSPEDALPYLVNFSTCSVRAETMLHFLSARGIFVSSGSACAKDKASHVLEAMGVNRPRQLTALRVSFSRFNTKEDVDALAEAVREGIKTLAKGKL